MLNNIGSRVICLGENVASEWILGKEVGDGEDSSRPDSAGARSLLSRIGGGEIVMAGSRFGCGRRGREAAGVLKKAGVACLVARSFDRVFFRAAINQGLPALEADIVGEVADGSVIEIDFEHSRIIVPERVHVVAPFPQRLADVISAGGLLAYVRESLSG